MPSDHYMLSAADRLQEIVGLILRRQYFVIHAARQSGKTTLLLDLARSLDNGDGYYALYCTLEGLQGIIDPKSGMPAAANSILDAVTTQNLLDANELRSLLDFDDFTNVVKILLRNICSRLDKPLVLLLDEADCLTEGTLISFLRQLRDGFVNRAAGMPFPSSIALVGMRNIRDYKAKVRPDGTTPDPAGFFTTGGQWWCTY